MSAGALTLALRISWRRIPMSVGTNGVKYHRPDNHRAIFVANFSSRKSSRFSIRSSQRCPFQTLGVARDIDYASVKRAFLKLAMVHHPDTAEGVDECDVRRKEAMEMFMQVRDAFENIVEMDDGRAVLRGEDSEAMSDDSFNDWFRRETGKDAPNPFDLNLDPDTLKEVAESQTQAGLDRGGMWHMASVLTQGPGGGGLGPQLRLEEGDRPFTQATNGKIRRRRRRPGW